MMATRASTLDNVGGANTDTGCSEGIGPSLAPIVFCVYATSNRDEARSKAYTIIPYRYRASNVTLVPVVACKKTCPQTPQRYYYLCWGRIT